MDKTQSTGIGYDRSGGIGVREETAPSFDDLGLGEKIVVNLVFLFGVMPLMN